MQHIKKLGEKPQNNIFLPQNMHQNILFV